MNRRELMQAGALGLLAMPLASIGAEPATTSVGYDGPGIYLYPAWGTPCAYAVLPAADGKMLEFRDTASGEVRWRQTPALDCEFAAKLARL